MVGLGWYFKDLVLWRLSISRFQKLSKKKTFKLFNNFFMLIYINILRERDLEQHSRELCLFLTYWFFKDLIYLFLERKREGKRDREKYQCLLASCTPHNPGMCPRLGIEPATHWFTGRGSVHWATPARTNLLIFFLEREKKREREKHQFVVPHIYAFIGWFLYVPWLGIEPATLAYWDDAPTNWASGQGLELCLNQTYVCPVGIQHIR